MQASLFPSHTGIGIPPVPLLMQVFISVALLAATLFVILSKRYDVKDKHWAYTTIGVIVGFWLKP